MKDIDHLYVPDMLFYVCKKFKAFLRLELEYTSFGGISSSKLGAFSSLKIFRPVVFLSNILLSELL